MRHIRTAPAALLVTAFAWVSGVAAQGTYPSKPVRLVVPVAPGGNQDVVARAVAEPLARALGQQVLVESRPGVSATVGTRFVKAAPPDGYILLTISNTFVRTPAVMADAGYDPLKDFVPVTMTADVPLVLVVNPALPVKNVQELIALAKRRPGEITSAASGVGSTGHVATEAFSRRAGIRMLHVQYKGAAPAVVDLLGGHVMLRFDQVTTSLAHIRTGRLRALAVTSRTRSGVLPDVPTMEEAGVRPFHDTTFNGLMAPAGTPREIVERVHAEVVRAVAAPELRNRFGQQGIEMVASKTPEGFGAFLRQQVEEFAVLAKEAGMQIR
jgi:tripartite-type tricarboxylate transporter receptor subunit TctC